MFPGIVSTRPGFFGLPQMRHGISPQFGYEFGLSLRFFLIRRPRAGADHEVLRICGTTDTPPSDRWWPFLLARENLFSQIQASPQLVHEASERRFGEFYIGDFQSAHIRCSQVSRPIRVIPFFRGWVNQNIANCPQTKPRLRDFTPASPHGVPAKIRDPLVEAGVSVFVGRRWFNWIIAKSLKRRTKPVDLAFVDGK
jgi:hypothetical protein